MWKLGCSEVRTTLLPGSLAGADPGTREPTGTAEGMRSLVLSPCPHRPDAKGAPSSLLGTPALGSLGGQEDCPWVHFLIPDSPGQVGGSGAGPPLSSHLHHPGWSGSLTPQASGHPERLPQSAGPLVG